MVIEGMLQDEQLCMVDDFAGWGITAFTTTRALGTLGSNGDESIRDVLGRWELIRSSVGPGVDRLATANQVHGARIFVHRGDWSGWLRGPEGDGHISLARGTALAVSVADCVPVFVAHSSGAVAALHAGWRGVAAGVLEAGISKLGAHGLVPEELKIHLGPSICGDCYEVGPEVHEGMTGSRPQGNSRIDLRANLEQRARRLGVRDISVSPWCTLCHNDIFFSHRAGDTGRQSAVISSWSTQ